MEFRGIIIDGKLAWNRPCQNVPCCNWWMAAPLFRNLLGWCSWQRFTSAGSSAGRHRQVTL